jgi:hypothetical protein
MRSGSREENDEPITGGCGRYRDRVERRLCGDLYPHFASAGRCCSAIGWGARLHDDHHGRFADTDRTTTITKGVDANGNEITKKDSYREGVAGSSERLSWRKLGIPGPSDLETGHRRRDDSRLTLGNGLRPSAALFQT